MIFNAYGASGVRQPVCSTAMIAERLPALPLLFQPGEGWEYSMAHRRAGQAGGDHHRPALHRCACSSVCFGPLGLVDTGYVLRPEQVPRLAALYGGNFAGPRRARTAAPRRTALARRVPDPGAARGGRQRSLHHAVPTLLSLLVPACSPAVAGRSPTPPLAEMSRDQCAHPSLRAVPADADRCRPWGSACASARSRGRPSTLQPNTPAGFRYCHGGGWRARTGRLSPATARGNALVLDRRGSASLRGAGTHVLVPNAKAAAYGRLNTARGA